MSMRPRRHGSGRPGSRPRPRVTGRIAGPLSLLTVPDRRRKTKSKYTTDRMMPGAFEGETVTRRRFMTGTAHGAGAIAAAAFTLPALGFALGPVFEETPHTWQDIGGVDDFP